jgi:predicted flap endonuclease-1-like 5' DNA nuclease
MKQSDMKNAPWLGGWVIAAAAGLVAGGVTHVVGDLSLRQSGFIGILVCLVVGLFMAMPWGAGSSRQKAALPTSKPVAAEAARPVAVAAPAMATPAVAASAPVMAEAAPAAAFMSAPVAEPAAAKPARAAKPKAAPAAKVAAKPAAKPAVAKAPKAKKPDGPLRLSAPRKGKADDLKEIEGIGPALEKLCNSLGFYHFDQIAGWSDADVAWVDANMKTFKGRIVRDKWIAQSKIIISEGLEAFRVRAQTNNY